MQTHAESTLNIEVAHVKHHNQEDGFSIVQAFDCDSGEPVRVAGVFFDPRPHDFYVVFGRWIEHRQFGKQFKASRSVVSRPTTKSAICRYLSSGIFVGVGPRTAKRIVDYLGTKTFQILESDPERIKSIPKLGKKQAQVILDCWQEKVAEREVTMFLSQHNITPSVGKKLLKQYGNNLIPAICANPYQMINAIHGVGFLTADKIAQSVGIKDDDPHRIQESVLYTLAQAEQKGHCYLPLTGLLEHMSMILDISVDQLKLVIDHHLQILGDRKKIAIATELDSSENIYYLWDLFQCEQSVRNQLHELMQAPFLSPKPDDPGYDKRISDWIEAFSMRAEQQLSEDQLASVMKAALSKVFVLTGGPGVGKTTTANTIIHLFRAMGKTVVLAAPTGRAAQRMSEVSAIPAKTIHRLLEWLPNEFCFSRSRHNPIAAEIVIVDEASMLDIRLAASLIDAIRPTSRLILIGDVDQLPPVGPGNVLRDLIDSNAIPFFRLHKVFRQAACSAIIKIAHAINQGEKPDFNDGPESDCRFVQCADSESMLKAIEQICSVHLAKAGYDPIRDVQILTPMNRGILGASNLNQLMQGILNPDTDSLVTPGKFRVGDKVIQNVNNYDLAVFNGDIGTVLAGESDGSTTTVQFNDRLVYYDREGASDLSLAYAITIHKSQGSEFKVVILPIAMSHYVMLMRNLIYTGLTRARKLAIFVGEKKALYFAAQNIESANRRTRLSPLLKGDL